MQICPNQQITVCELVVFRPAIEAKLQLVAPSILLAVEAVPLYL